ncbi:MAG TPA: SCO family protein [Candidatus Acidoferrum sp.]|nr:SCO family protein [Candidatus Acidoferrum sp.]
MMIARVATIHLLTLALWLSPGVGSAHDPAQQPDHSTHGQAVPAEGISVERSRLSIPDVPVLDQHGKQIRFYTDLVQGKVVAINFIYTICTTICPVLGATFANVQDQMGDRSGKEFSLISVSVDPVTDTPERLKAWAARFKARPGWTLVTGRKPDIDRLLRSLGASSAQKEDHPPLVLMGNDPMGLWTRAYGLMPLTELIRDMMEGRVTTAPTQK